MRSSTFDSSRGRCIHGGRSGLLGLLVFGLGMGFSVSDARSSETTWFGGTDRAFPISLADFKDNGIRSHWLYGNESEGYWDLSVGTDVAMWELRTERLRHVIGGRFGVSTRFEFGSESFDLWAADIRGGGGWGIEYQDWAFEALFLHESSHLGDEILERGDRPRIDASVNEFRLSVSRSWGERWRVYGALSGIPWAKPEELQSFGLRLGGEVLELPPWRRGFAAVELAVWEWRDGRPDVHAQLGLFVGPRDEEKFLSTARTFVQVATGAVGFWQFYNERETTIGLGVALDW